MAGECDGIFDSSNNSLVLLEGRDVALNFFGVLSNSNTKSVLEDFVRG